MSANDQVSSETRPQEGMIEEKEADIIPLQRCPHLYIKHTLAKGRGVFSSLPLPASTILDTSPVLPLSPAENTQHIAKTELFHYTYNWPAPIDNNRPPHQLPTQEPNHHQNDQQEPLTAKPQALILGLGSMFNHSLLHQNVGWTRDVERLVIVYRTLRDVAAHEELCISYGSPGQLTFVDAETEEARREEEEEERRMGEGGGWMGWMGGIEL